jgi:nitrate/TMAO reductase-like tetraheme cytochrome c subunit
MGTRRRGLLLLPSLVVAGCGDGERAEETRVLPREALLDSATCKECHQEHYDEWAGSMHAYASIDPVFRAMNARGQREAQIGNFCINCHAPMAVREAQSADPIDIQQVPEHLQGVTCYFCHNVASVDGAHNNPLTLANDQTMRAQIKNPVKNKAHRSEYSPFVDRETKESSSACGACHDIVTPSPPAPQPVALERTFIEWQGTLFAESAGCASCHMVTKPDSLIATAPGVVNRPHRSIHTFPGVDLALTPFRDEERQRKSVSDFLDTSIHARICVQYLPNGSRFQVQIDNNIVGHNWPSGAAQDRRAWIEAIAYGTSGEVIYSSGVVAEGEDVTTLADPDLWLLRDILKDEQGNDVHMFWEAFQVVERTIPGSATLSVIDPRYFASHPFRIYPRTEGIAGIGGVPARITLRIRVQPMGYDVLDELIALGDLDPVVRKAMPIIDVLPNRGVPNLPYEGSRFTIEWTPALAEDPRFGLTGSIGGRVADGGCATSGQPPS